MHAPGHLPPELYSHIFSHISSGSDISAVARTCTIFRDLATPFLYHTIRPDCVEPERLKQLLARIAESPRAASSVRILDLTWQLETDIFDSAHPPTDAALRSIASRATPALNSMCNLTTLLLAHDIDKAADLLERCTLPSLKALQASFSSPVHAFLERHPRVTALELLPSLQRAASTFPAGDPLVYLGGTCGLIAQALAPSSARELSNLAILHIRRGYPLQPLAFHALDAWHKRTGRRLQYLLFSNVATDYDGLMPGSFLPVEVERVVLVGIALDEVKFLMISCAWEAHTPVDSLLWFA